MQPGPAAVYHPPSHPFTHYIRRLKVDLDSAQYENGEEQVVWDRSQHGRNHRDSFEIRCASPACIAAYFNQSPILDLLAPLMCI